jgi:hypothetical protein
MNGKVNDQSARSGWSSAPMTQAPKSSTVKVAIIKSSGQGRWAG